MGLEDGLLRVVSFFLFFFKMVCRRRRDGFQQVVWDTGIRGNKGSLSWTGYYGNG